MSLFHHCKNSLLFVGSLVLIFHFSSEASTMYIYEQGISWFISDDDILKKKTSLLWQLRLSCTNPIGNFKLFHKVIDNMSGDTLSFTESKILGQRNDYLLPVSNSHFGHFSLVLRTFFYSDSFFFWLLILFLDFGKQFC